MQTHNTNSKTDTVASSVVKSSLCHQAGPTNTLLQRVAHQGNLLFRPSLPRRHSRPTPKNSSPLLATPRVLKVKARCHPWTASPQRERKQAAPLQERLRVKRQRATRTLNHLPQISPSQAKIVACRQRAKRTPSHLLPTVQDRRKRAERLRRSKKTSSTPSSSSPPWRRCECRNISAAWRAGTRQSS